MAFNLGISEVGPTSSTGQIAQLLATAQEPGALVQFKPEETAIRDSAYNGARQAAQRIRDWEALEAAVDAQLAEQVAFVEWWEGRVTTRISPGRAGNKSNAHLHSISVKDAEALTGISQPQVSRWRKRLSDRDTYRTYLYGHAWRKAMMEAQDNHRAQGTGENEWYTPDTYLDMARGVLGGIDLERASFFWL